MKTQITLKAARVNADLTQAELAERLGVSATTVSNWESGATGIQVADFMRWCEVCGVGLEDISLPAKSTKSV